MAAYYNEFDEKAAAWLRELIAKGLIADGVVDTRSIVDVEPRQLAGFTQCHFFAGIGVWSYALRRAGVSDDTPVWTGSAPCQPFSAAGKGAGFDDERHVWPAWQWLIEQRRPELIFGEQVASKDAEPWLDLVQADLEGLDYAFGACAFPSASVGAPHIRDRTYWVANADNTRPQGRVGVPQRSAERAAGAGGLVGSLADADRGQRDGQSIIRGAERDGQDAGRPESGGELGSRRVDSGLANSDGARHLPGAFGGIHSGEGGAGPRHGEPERSGADGRVADASIFGRERGRSGETGNAPRTLERSDGLRDAGCLAGHADPHGARDEREHGLREVAAHAGPVNGGWGNADWIYCRNGEWRPVEPGTFPLVNGASARVGRLRGYGNAVNASAATVFIQSYLEARS